MDFLKKCAQLPNKHASRHYQGQGVHQGDTGGTWDPTDQVANVHFWSISTCALGNSPPTPTHKTAQQGLGGGACNFADAGCLSRCVWLSGTLGQPLGRGWSNGAARVLLGGVTRGSKTAYFGANSVERGDFGGDKMAPRWCYGRPKYPRRKLRVERPHRRSPKLFLVAKTLSWGGHTLFFGQIWQDSILDSKKVLPDVPIVFCCPPCVQSSWTRSIEQ